MKKMKLSVVEKKLLCTMLAFILIQMLIVFGFARFLNSSQPVDIQDIKQIDIVAEDISTVRVPRENWLIVVADSEQYVFENHSWHEEYSVNELYDSISEGDRLSLMYYESRNLFLGKANMVVDARTETEIYRSIEEYNRGKVGLPAAVAAIFSVSVIELFYIGVVAVYIWLNQNIIKRLYRKIKKSVKTN